ncbi:MAG TPA: hypothetical protein PLR50_00805 [Candidatus Rifleibacterium sp.]|nr:hypothetical protein [Candidatus Rifleibacterium sp.]
MRARQLWGLSPMGWFAPGRSRPGISEDLAAEFGIDACRIALVSEGARLPAEPLDQLEAAFKWLARIFRDSQQDSAVHNPEPWLEAAAQSRDHLLCRSDLRAALMSVKHAAKVSPPQIKAGGRFKSLVLACLYPFVPVLAAQLAGSPDNMLLSLPQIVEEFPEYLCVRFAIADSGWQNRVFNARHFKSDPKKSLLQVKAVARAAGKKDFFIQNADGGLRICFS